MNVVEVQPRRRLVEQKQAAFPALPGQVRPQADPLRFAPGKRRGRLAQPQVPQADLVQHLQLLLHARRGGKEADRFLHRHLQHVMNVFSLVSNRQHLGLIASPAALLADQLHVGQKLHLHGDGAVALTRFTAPAGDVEGERARFVAAPARLALRGKQLPDAVERLHIRHRIRARRPAERRLIDQDDLANLLIPGYAVQLRARRGHPAPPPQGVIKNVVDQRRFAGPRDAGHARHHAQGNRHVDILQVVLARAANLNLAPLRYSPLGGHRNLKLAGKIPSGQGPLVSLHFIIGTLTDDASSLLAGSRSQV